MTISELYKKKQINLRLHNICIDNDLYTFDCVQNHYLSYKTFTNLKKCGKKSNTELIGLYLSLRHILDNTDSTSNGKCLLVTISEMKPQILRILDKFILVSFYNLSNRAQKSLVMYLGSQPELEIFKQKILTRSFSTHNLQNAGQKTIEEITFYVEKVINLIELLGKAENNSEQDTSINKFLLENTYPFNVVPENIIEKNSIFTTVKYLLENHLLFKKNKSLVIQETGNIYLSKHHNDYEDLAIQLNTTSERVRHLRRVALEKLRNKLQLIRIIDDVYLRRFKGLNHQEIINIDDRFQSKINNENGTEFSKGFIAILMGIYLQEFYDLKRGGNINSLNKILSHSPTDEERNYKLISTIKKSNIK